jgi:hypothetical protein
MSLYLYCLARNLPALNIVGIQSQNVSIFSAGPFEVIVSLFTGNDLKPTRENIFAHERVVESIMSIVTPLPFRFGTVVTEDKLRSFVDANTEELRLNLESVQDCVEMGLKVLLPGENGSALPVATTGTEFLKIRRKKQEIQKEIANWIDGRLMDRIRKSDASIVAGTERTMVRIAHLVPKCHLSEYKALIDTLVQERTDLGFLRSGPWPPYSFISTPRLG